METEVLTVILIDGLPTEDAPRRQRPTISVSTMAHKKGQPQSHPIVSHIRIFFAKKAASCSAVNHPSASCPSTFSP